MSNSLRPYNYWKEDGQYIFETSSGTRYTAYFLALNSFSDNLYTFNFDRVLDGNGCRFDGRVRDTICTILKSFFETHSNALLLVCDSFDGKERARKRLFSLWFEKNAPEGLLKIDREQLTEDYNLFASLMIWDNNPQKEEILIKFEEYCSSIT